MTKPIAEDSYARAIGRNAFGVYQAERRPSSPARFQIKLFGDADAATSGDGIFIMSIPTDVDTDRLQDVSAFVTTVGGSITTIQIRNITQANVDMLSRPLTIDGGEKSSKTALVKAAINPLVAQVFEDDQLAIDIDTAGGGKGLGVILGFW